MTISTTTSHDGNTITIRVKGRFDFNLVQDFRCAYQEQKKPTANYVIDLADTDYMDSAALGMLLHLWRFAGGEKARVKVINCRPGVRKIFEITHFDKKIEVA
jgi:anti-anti-sigma factor